MGGLDPRRQSRVLAGDLGDHLIGHDGVPFGQPAAVAVAADLQPAGRFHLQHDALRGPQRAGGDDQVLDVAGRHFGGAHRNQEIDRVRRARGLAAEDRGAGRGRGEQSQTR